MQFQTVIVLLALASVCAGHSVEMHATRHTLTRKVGMEAVGVHAHHTLLKPALATGAATVPMSGGLLTLGAYFVNVSVGGQVIPALVDTGSSNAWFVTYKPSASYAPLPCASAECQACNVDGNSGCLFGPPQCSPDGTCGWGITYGGGQSLAAGLLGNDHFCFAGSDLCMSAAPFGTVDVNLPAQGALGAIIGLAFPRNACNPSCVTTVMSALAAQDPALGMFSMCLTPGAGGVIDFGLVNSSRLAGPVVPIRTTHDHWYNIAVVDITVGDGPSSGLPRIAFGVTNDVIGSFVDSGTSILIMGSLPYAAVQSSFMTKYASLPGVKALFAGQCVPHATIDPVISSYPDVNVHIDTNGNHGPANIVSFAIPPASYLLDTGADYCLGIAQVSGIGVILGDVFLENFVTVYNPAEGSIGLAPLVPGSCVA